jgi:transposase
MGGGDHQCEWREMAESLGAELGTASSSLAAMTERVAALEATLTKLQRHVFGQRSEKMPPVKEELRKQGFIQTDPEATLAKRREHLEAKQALVAREIVHEVPAEKKVCAKCGCVFRKIGKGRRTTIFELVPPTIERQVHVQDVERCQCGETIVTADGPPKAFEKAGYGPAFLANTVVAKCCDSIPLTRLSTQYARSGLRVPRTTLISHFGRVAVELAILSNRLIELVPEIEIAHADETPTRVLDTGKTRRAYIWTFLGTTKDDKEIVAYKYSPSRSGETAAKVLGKSAGKLVVDAFGGYNIVTLPDGRIRIGCLAHTRRGFFDALGDDASAARTALDYILEIYKVEERAKETGIAGTAEHLALRQQISRKVMDDFKAWLDAEKPKHLPKGPMGAAIGYALNQWETLIRFLDDARVPVDNNKAERALRAAALGKRNWLFVGNDKAGENLAGLYSLVATCVANGVNPAAYLTDVLVRLGTHPASRLDELLPQNWTPLTPKPPT